jgi:nucleotide-binding universal stress UspA family protein
MALLRSGVAHLTNKFSYSLAIQDFQQARHAAGLQEIFARLTRRQTSLLSYEEVRDKLRAIEMAHQELKEIPLEAIVGSVGRYDEFTKTFLPRYDRDKERWANVMALAKDADLPPIEVYQIGEAYFVQDGNHRVSVARHLEWNKIYAYVRQVQTKVALTPDLSPDELIIIAEYTDFLESTRLDELRPQVDLSVTAPGKYSTLSKQIEMVRLMGDPTTEAEMTNEEAAVYWCDEVYMPIVETMQEVDILDDFPKRTETDLYIWLSDHRAVMMATLGWEISPESATVDLAARQSPKSGRRLARITGNILNALKPTQLVSGPQPGQWRQRKLANPKGHLFGDILVALAETETGQAALDMAMEVAQIEGAQLHGLHILPAKGLADDAKAEHLQKTFEQRLTAAGLSGKLAFDKGQPAQTIFQRARWADLVVLPLHFPYQESRLSRLSSGLRSLIQRCSVPLLIIPYKSTPLKRALLAYDGSPSADEALFLAAYTANLWGLNLVVATAFKKGRVTHDVLAHAREYLENYRVEAEYVETRGSLDTAILKTADIYLCDLLITGNYGANPIRGAMRGSMLDKVLRGSQMPILVSR